MINVVSFNGGRGAKSLIPAFLDTVGVNLTCIVNAYDDGKSTGTIRDFFKMLGPSDIRKVQETMVPEDLPDHEAVLKVFEYRYANDTTYEEAVGALNDFADKRTDLLVGCSFKDDNIRESLRTFVKAALNGIQLVETIEGRRMSFSDCSIMNFIYAGAVLYFNGDFEEATVFIDRLFKLNGTVLPTNGEDKKLVAIREDGTILFSEAEIVELRSNSRIKKIYLLDQYPSRELLNKIPVAQAEAYFEMINRQVAVTQRVERSLKDADIIVYAPGTQHSSLYPSYMTKGVADAIIGNKKALKVFITNIGADYETPSYTASDYIKGGIRYLQMGTQYKFDVQDIITHALVNNKFSTNLESYVKFEKTDLEKIGCAIILDEFEDIHNSGKHNGAKIAEVIMELYSKKFQLTGWQK